MIYVEAVLSGVGMTVLITLLSFTVGAVLGVPLALARRSAFAPRARRDPVRSSTCCAASRRSCSCS